MAQFDIHKNKNDRTAASTPYLLDIQSDAVSVIGTRLVVPLRPASEYEEETITRLHPIIQLVGRRYVAFTTEMAGLPASLLGPIVGSARDQRKEIVDATDLLITGF